MKKVLLTGDKIYDSYQEEKKDKTIVYKDKKNKKQIKPDISEDTKNRR